MSKSFWTSLANYASRLGAKRPTVEDTPVDAPHPGEVVSVAGRTGIVAFYREHGGRIFGYVVFDLYQGNNFLPENLTAIG